MLLLLELYVYGSCYLSSRNVSAFVTFTTTKNDGKIILTII